MIYFLGEIRLFSTPHVPSGWAFCDGAILSTNAYPVLFDYIGNKYGGDAKNNTFALPDLRGRLAIHQGKDPRTGRQIARGDTGGTLTTTLTEANLPAHTHALNVISAAGNKDSVKGNVFAKMVTPPEQHYNGGAALVRMDENMIILPTAAAPISNIQPVLGIYFAIAMTGIKPTRP